MHPRSASSSPSGSPGGASRPRRRAGQALDVAAWAVPFGIVGGRLYHVITTPGAVLRRGRQPGRRPQDLGGRPRHLGRDRARRARRLDRLPAPRRRASSPSSTPPPRASRSPRRSAAWATGSTTSSTAGRPTCRGAWRSTSGTRPRAARSSTPRATPSCSGTFHPTFLYEVALVPRRARRRVLLVVDRRLPLRHGQVFGLYVAGYPVGPHRHREDAHRRGQAHPRASGSTSGRASSSSCSASGSSGTPGGGAGATASRPAERTASPSDVG